LFQAWKFNQLSKFNEICSNFKKKFYPFVDKSNPGKSEIETIGTDEFDPLYHHYKKNCDVYMIYEGKFKLIKSYKLSYDSLISILFANKHYYKITSDTMIK
jgi:hypothetical protein